MVLLCYYLSMSYERHNWNNVGIKEGEDIERGFFGQAGKKFNGELVYMPYKRALESAIDNQPDRLPYFTQRLLSKVDEAYPNLAGMINFYTAVGTSLDVYHGVDAFFKLQDHIVTLDVTSNDSKTHAKADIIVQTGYDEDGGIDFSDEQMASLAKQVGVEFITKIKKRI